MADSNVFVINLTNKKSVAATKNRLLRWYNYLKTGVDYRIIKREIEIDYLRPLMAQLRNIEPSKRKYPDDYPIRFTSDKQRRYVMRLLNGKPYIRTKRLSRGWYYETKITREGISFSVGNKAPYSKFAVGRLGVSDKKQEIYRYLKPIQRFHTVTGWTAAIYPVGRTRKRIEDHVRKRLKQYIVTGIAS